MPEATVTVKNVNTGLTQTVKTSADGVYNVLYLPAGDYTVTTEKAGFRKAETSGVGVHVATVANVDVTLAVGGDGPVGGSDAPPRRFWTYREPISEKSSRRMQSRTCRCSSAVD